MPDIAAIQSELRKADVQGWLFYDFHHRDPIAANVLGLSGGMATRRWFYLIPRTGTPRKLVHRIESGALDSLVGKKLLYASAEELENRLRSLLSGIKSVAMQYSPCNAIPYVSLVDAGTVELVRSMRCKVVSSADLVQRFEACWSDAQYQSHLSAGRTIDKVVHDAFSHAAARVGRKEPLTEYELQQQILALFDANGIVTAERPVVAAGSHSGDPHYEPVAQRSAKIHKGDLLLLDVWGKLKQRDSVYYDVTWIGYLGAQVPSKYEKIFAIVREARDGAVRFVSQSLADGRAIQGWQVDRAARDVIQRAGYGKYFIHRTGHNIGREVHGNGANMDSLETHDTRQLLPRTCFSIEPGIYLPQFGIRSELNVYIGTGGATVTGPVQESIIPLLA